MIEPATPIPSKGLFTDYREPPPSTETTTPTPDDHDDNDDENDDEESNCRDYHEENMMVELLEKRRKLYARTRSLNPSTVRVSYLTPTPPPSLLVGDPSDNPTEETRTTRRSTPLYRRRPGRVSSKMTDHGGDSSDNYDNKNRTRRSTTDIVRELWSRFRDLCRRLDLRRRYTPEETTIVATAGTARHHHHYNIDKVATTYYNNEAGIIKWILISFLMGLIMTVMSCLIVPRDGSPSHSPSTPRYFTKDRHPHHPSPTNDALDPTSIRSPTDRPLSTSEVDMDWRTEYESLVRRITNLEQSQRNRNVDFRLIHEQLRSGRWIEDKIMEVIRNELPAELVLAKDPISGKVRVPEEFWDAVREVLEAKGGKLSQRTAVLSRHEFLYLVVTESNAVWASLQGRVDSFVQRQLAQWVERELDDGSGSGGGVQGFVSRVEQQILTEMIDRAIERYHTRQSIHRHIDAQPDYALYNSGGRIIPHLTTHTYHRYKPTTILGRLFGLQNWIPPPSPPSSPDSDREQVNKVIQPEMNPGDCWPMQGGWGQVAIQLAKRVVVTEIVIEHVDPRIALHRGTAPREIEIWRLAAPTTNPSSSSSTEEDGEKRRMTNDGNAGESPILATWYKFGSPFPGASLLTTITYQQEQQQPIGTCDGSKDGDRIGEAETEIETVQRFSIPLSKQNVPAYGIVVRVLSNWGHPDFTCLYRVRVHGRAV
ncbi:hypothetical protein BGZ90_011045 [Linnemannia elongata]|nr:hypothetical protein BGZ90_011045 [Linnemannia elongata]